MSFEILKGLYLFWSSFFEGHFECIFLASSHILSLNFKPYGFLLFLLNCFFMASFAIFINILALFQLLCNPSKESFSFSNSIFIIKSPFYKCLPKLSLNGICPVTAYFLLLYWNSAANNHSIQSSC